MDEATIDSRPRGKAALLIVDMINDLDFPGGPAMLPAAREAADAIARLARKARAAGAAIVYVNDNYGQWHSERSRIVDHCGRPDAVGRALVEKLRPEDDDYFVIKPQFSGFYSTNLPALLPRLGARRLILTGISADICILFTAGDAHMREYDLWIPQDCVASSDSQRTHWALAIMRNSMRAETRATSELELDAWLDRDGEK